MRTLTPSCVLLFWMLTLAFVKSQDCTLQQFKNSNLYDLNFDITNLQESYPAGKQVRVNCNVGFTGFYKILCIEGKWEPKGTKCAPKSCGHPGDAQFADFQLEKGDDFIFGSKVVYTCHNGYHMVSRRNYRTCMADGWDGIIPVCEAQHCPEIHVKDNVQVNGDTEEATFGNVVRFNCKSNSEILEGPTELYCNEKGEWSGTAPICKAVTCTLPQIENGLVTEVFEEYKEHEVLHYECSSGYQRAEERQSRCIKIGQRADWSPTPACELIKCKLLPPPPGTSYRPEYKNVFSPGEILTVSCDQWSWISNRLKRTADIRCNEDGKWSENHLCQEVICIRQDPHVRYWGRTWGTIKIDDTVDYWCDEGWRQNKKTYGTIKATCTRPGWEPDPLCEEITCRPEEIRHADITNPKPQYKYRERVDYVCKDGHRGQLSLICEENGWRGKRECTPITCNRPSDPIANLKRPKNEYRYNEQVEFVCKIVGESYTLTCGDYGWVGTPTCRDPKCNRPSDPNANLKGRPKNEYNYNEQVEFVCKTGRKSYTLTCGDNVWVGTPTCTDRKGPKPKVANGFVVGPFNDTVYYTCNEGYKLLSPGWWGEATFNGSAWLGLQQCIEQTDCPLPDVPNGQVTTPKPSYKTKDTVQITCNKGYGAENNEATCKNGLWEPDLNKSCALIAKTCSAPPKVENAVVMTPYQKEYLSQSKVTYQCRPGYSLEGKQMITCNNKGKWGSVTINCIAPTEQPSTDDPDPTV